MFQLTRNLLMLCFTILYRLVIFVAHGYPIWAPTVPEKTNLPIRRERSRCQVRFPTPRQADTSFQMHQPGHLNLKNIPLGDLTNNSTCSSQQSRLSYSSSPSSRLPRPVSETPSSTLHQIKLPIAHRPRHGRMNHMALWDKDSTGGNIIISVMSVPGKIDIEKIISYLYILLSVYRLSSLWYHWPSLYHNFVVMEEFYHEIGDYLVGYK
ncbi:hypothetical protein GcC1_03218 [Golovinomyces cichoracearum]|uniref:Uncharacterized protein n=1 Tax=Golovinomyces cichoracearum TaxID=62708 RepID=A0A420I8Z5_9PEZI|nr:hypothetical protein GcC1_03218 [Golovinomyces cichoracearum]